MARLVTLSIVLYGNGNPAILESLQWRGMACSSKISIHQIYMGHTPHRWWFRIDGTCLPCQRSLSQVWCSRSSGRSFQPNGSDADYTFLGVEQGRAPYIPLRSSASHQALSITDRIKSHIILYFEQKRRGALIHLTCTCSTYEQQSWKSQNMIFVILLNGCKVIIKLTSSCLVRVTAKLRCDSVRPLQAAARLPGPGTARFLCRNCSIRVWLTSSYLRYRMRCRLWLLHRYELGFYFVGFDKPVTLVKIVQDYVR